MPIHQRPTWRRLLVRLPLSTGFPSLTSIRLTKPLPQSELAQRCRISQYDFDRFNPNVCGNIYVGMRMCCTQPVCCLSPPSSRRRTVPPPPTIELSPPPPAGGSCETYTVKGGDTCEDIASAFGVSEDGLDRINVFTSGWGGCSALVDGTVICECLVLFCGFYGGCKYLFSADLLTWLFCQALRSLYRMTSRS